MRHRKSSAEPVCQRPACVKRRQRLRKAGEWYSWVLTLRQGKDAPAGVSVRKTGVVAKPEKVEQPRTALQQWCALALAGVCVSGAGEEWLARHPAIRGVTGAGETAGRAIADWQEALEQWATLMEARGLPEV